MSEKYLLIELNLYAEGAYSGATYEEVRFITVQDYIKYFGSGQDTDAEDFEEYIYNTWNGREIYVGELDGKHSEVSGTVKVDFWDANRIAEYYSEDYSEDGENLLDEITADAIGSKASFKEECDFAEEISKHVKEVIDSIGTKVEVTVRVPKDKVEELNAFVEKLNS